jgi:hypothetical protein
MHRSITALALHLVRLAQPSVLHLLALIALVALLGHVRAPQLLITLGPQRTVRTNNSLAGMHTRFVEEVETWKIKRGLEMIREMGAPWIVEFFPWAYYEPAKGQRDFSAAERIIAHANRQGLTVIARLGFVPAWARPDNTTFTYLDPERYADFADFAASFAQHFRGRVSHFIVWNEPNLQNEWGMRRVDPVGYVAMLRAVYPAIKRANPDAIVLAGALAPTIERNRDVALSDLEYLAEMYRALRDNHASPTIGTATKSVTSPPWDGLAAHTYGLTMPPEAPPNPNVVNFRRVELLRAIMEAHGDTTPIYITEAGWNDDVNWVNGVTPAERIHYTLRALAYAKAHWPWVRCVAFWVFKLPAPARGYRDHFTFVTPSLEPLPIYDELRRALVP